MHIFSALIYSTYMYI